MGNAPVLSVVVDEGAAIGAELKGVGELVGK